MNNQCNISEVREQAKGTMIMGFAGNVVMRALMGAAGTFLVVLTSILPPQAACGEPFRANVSDDPATRDKTELHGKHIIAYVPEDAADRLVPLVQRLDRVFAFMCEEAGHTPGKKLVVNIVDEDDMLQGWASVIPRPVVELNLAPGYYGGFFAGGERRLELVAIHEFAHILSIDMTFGVRKVFERIFGRVVPQDILSLGAAYFTVPSQATMPLFWLEGLAQWAETRYSDPDGIWGGRGRDSYTHMIWRLDAEAGKIPEAEDWRSSYIHWPEGSRPYNYGLAYTRYLDGAYGDRCSMWRFTRNQAGNWPFVFDRAPAALIEKRHSDLIREARQSLMAEQKRNIRELKSVPVTPLKRLTPVDHEFGAPAWTSDGRLFASSYRPFARRQRYVTIDSKGDMESTGVPSLGTAPSRRSPGGSIVTSTFVRTVKGRYRSRITVVRPSGDVFHTGLRLIHPDLAERVFGKDDAVAAIRFTGAGDQSLRLYRLEGKTLHTETVMPVEGVPWDPAFRPRLNGPPMELAWVETDATSSRIMLSPIARPDIRRTLLTAKGRILHPVFSADGNTLFYCSDVSGVLNAYRLSLAAEKLKPAPVTHTIGGVIACTPSPDGKYLAVLDHDSGGPFISIIPDRRRVAPGNLPEIPLHWPAPEGVLYTKPSREKFTLPPAAEDPQELSRKSYNGLKHIEFQYWTPTTAVTETGGIGIQAALGDPIERHSIKAGAGIGAVEAEPVGQVFYRYGGWARTDVVFTGYALESTYNERIRTVWEEDADYTETLYGGNAGFIFDLSGIERMLSASFSIGAHDRSPVEESERVMKNRILISQPAFEGLENYAQSGLYYNDMTLYPTSYAAEDGLRVSLEYRLSGRDLGGDLDRDRALGKAGYIFSVSPEGGHQIEGNVFAGWSDGEDILQGAFVIGGTSYDGIEAPRGYIDTEATGPFLGAYSAAYRLPVYRPFKGLSTTPFELRQLVVEGFYEAGLISSDKPFGDGSWLRSVGLETTFEMRFMGVPIRPGFWVARQLDGEEDIEFSFVLRGIF